MARNPTWATSLSVHDHDHELEDISPGATRRWCSALEALSSRLSRVPTSGLTPRARVTAAMLAHELGAQLESARLAFETWSVDQLGGPQVALLDLVRVHAVRDGASMASFLSRVEAMPRFV